LTCNHESRPVPFARLVEAILLIYSTERYARKTYLRVRQVLGELAAIGGVETTADLTGETFARWAATRAGGNPNTLNGLLGTASAVCNFAVEEGWLGRAPNWKRLRQRPRAMTRNLPRTFDEIARLLAKLADDRRYGCWEDRRLCALTWTIALTACRLSEAVYAQVGDLDLGESPRLTIDPARRRLKTEASARSVPLPSALAAELAEWLPHAGGPWLFPGERRKGPWSGGTPAGKSLAQLQRSARSVGIERITWHSLRHAFGTYALERWGQPVWVVQRVMGHTDRRTTERYLHLDDSPVVARSMRAVAYGG
jgi:integrase